jgi:mono/diheme cytochrome c family protein
VTVLSVRVLRWIVFAALGASMAAGLVAWRNVRGEAPLDAPPVVPTPALVARGAYLARVGNCMGCHTAAGGADYAGGRGIPTPFGTVFAPNLTPDRATGLGAWSAAEFWRAMHNGRSRDGRLLSPAFPYPNFTSISREDSDALYGYLMSLNPVSQPNRAHELRSPFGTQAALAVWRAMFFEPGRFEAEPRQGAAWNRGKYLVQGLAHCAACHSERNAMGGVRAAFTGGAMPGEAWYAPSLVDPKEAGVQEWRREDVVRLLKDGTTAHAVVSGPMAEVVGRSTQHLSEADLEAMAQYLASLPVRQKPRPAAEPAPVSQLARGDELYRQHCADCHGKRGEGVDGIYPALAGNRAVTLDSARNLVQIIRRGGFAPSTAGHPRPFGMPPSGQMLPDEDIAAVATYVRQSWGHGASAVSALDVRQLD